jgi:hypothetical protein
MGCLYLNRPPLQSTWLCNSGQFISEGHLIISCQRMRVRYFMQVDPLKLIQFIVCQATEFGASLTPIRVVKFLKRAGLGSDQVNRLFELTISKEKRLIGA